MPLLLFLISVEQTAVHHSDADIERLILKIGEENDSEAFSELYALTKSGVYAYALSVCKNAHNAQDVMHDAYLSIYLNASRYIPVGKPMAWIFTIVKNLCLMQFRRANKSADEIPENTAHPDSLAFGKNVEDNEIISAAMSVLSDEERQIVVLHVVSGLKHREIAEFTELALSTVLSKYNRALMKMKKHLYSREVYSHE